ncbi:capsular biosynthesis protein [Loktanella sp. D2R18]|uniref:capsular polysaccharide export protein, LipB/KpsS family n=1 Tax=Rhodobacterales TaxID=204455 RepID=UPI000DEBB9E5|nr:MULTISPECIES: capsular biosynthesis protein [Rhodobacterales]MDO6589263.1 capsular biosynthesis protein [Yoonia sp. 1_MG-2023]RBW45314.1 capsular biosynthesis protein [Loktanella sp. D2R18]
MPEHQWDFVCLDPRKAKRAAVERALGPLGKITFRKTAPLGYKTYPETAQRVVEAFASATQKPTATLAVAAKKRLLALQYSGSRTYFEKHPDRVAVAWNGLNGTRRVFMDAAKDARAKTLYFELSPFKGRITVDPCGVNYRNGLPRTAAPYVHWAKKHADDDGWRKLGTTIVARTGQQAPNAAATPRPLNEKFIFIPLQVPGDSQLRLFGGAFPTVEQVIDAVAEAAKYLPDGWHARLKEHPTSPIKFGDRIAQLAHPQLVLDNVTDTFTQVAAARAVVTVNSSVGLEAMFFEKPVAAIGDCFWAIDGIANHCPTQDALNALFAQPETLSYDPQARNGFLNFLSQHYYPELDHDGPDGNLAPLEARKINARLMGPDKLGFWTCNNGIAR